MDAARIREIFAAFGPVRVRRMFGGQGVYAGDRMFALEADGELFVKVDEESVGDLQSVGSRPFVAVMNGREVAMSYWLLPEAALDDPEEAARWARAALAAAERAKSRLRRVSRRRPTSR